MKNYIGIRNKNGNIIYTYETSKERENIEKQYGKRNCKVFTSGHEKELYIWAGTQTISETPQQQKIRKEKELEKISKKMQKQTSNSNFNNSAYDFLQLINKYKENNISIIEIALTNELSYLVPIDTYFEWNLDKELRNLSVCVKTDEDISFETNYFIGAPGYGFDGFIDVIEELNKFQKTLKKEYAKNNIEYTNKTFNELLRKIVQDNDKHKAIISNDASDIDFNGNFITVSKTYYEDEGYFLLDEENISFNVNQIIYIKPVDENFKSIILYKPLIEILKEDT